MPEQQYKLAAILGPSSREIVNLIIKDFFSSQEISHHQPKRDEGNLAGEIARVLQGQLIYSSEILAGAEKPLRTVGLIFCIVSFTLQLTWFTVGLTYCRLSVSHWIVRRNEVGLFVPNTRYLLGILNMIFLVLLVSETTLLILNPKETLILKYRATIAGSIWLSLWFSSWVYAWGFGTGIYTSISKMPKGIAGRLVDLKYSVQGFNALVFGSLIIGITYEVSMLVFSGVGLVRLLDAHDTLVARFTTLASFYHREPPVSLRVQVLQEIPGLLNLAVAFETWLQTFHILLFSMLFTLWAFLCLSIPLYHVFFVITRGTKNQYCDVGTLHDCSSSDPTRSAEDSVLPSYEENLAVPHDQAPKTNPITTLRNFLLSDNHLVASAVIRVIAHTVVEVTVIIRFVYPWKQSGDVNALVNSVANTAVLNNFILAIIGLLPSWLFYKRCQLNQLEPFQNPPAVLHSRSNTQALIVPDIYDPWTLASPTTVGHLDTAPPESTISTKYDDSLNSRPQLRNFPDIRYLKEHLIEERSDCYTGLNQFLLDQKSSSSHQLPTYRN